MKFTIHGLKSTKKLPDSFEVKIKVMFGDADGYSSFKVGGFRRGSDEAALESLITTLERVQGKGYQRAAYPEVEGFYSWFGTSLAEDEAAYNDEYLSDVPYEAFAYHYALAQELATRTETYPDWPSDVAAGDGRDALLESFELFYYDLSGVKHRATWEPQAPQ
jgi:hypothetical protein